MAWTPDGRLLLTERSTGRVRVWQRGALQSTDWALIPGVNTAYYNETGLLGIAVDPDFLRNGYVYVFYTDTAGTQNHIARLQEVGGVGTGLTVLVNLPATAVHNGGRMLFGRDGNLYVGMGDLHNNALAQDLNNWCGKILRFSPPNLTVPNDNPYAGSPIWSYGHRNMYGLAVDPVSGGLFETENGNNSTDEVNRIVRGGNYGWPTYEGPEPAPDPTTIDPLDWFTPTVGLVGCAFYAGANYPATYQNDWFVLEYTNNRVRRLVLDATRTRVSSDTVFEDRPTGNALDVTSSPDGNLWLVSSSSGTLRGGDLLGRYVYNGEPMPSLNLTSVSARMLGGSMTASLHGHNGDTFFLWAADHRLATPVPSPIGAFTVPIDFVLPMVSVANDSRAYVYWSVPNLPQFLGATVHAQACMWPTSGLPAVTNAASLTIR